MEPETLDLEAFTAGDTWEGIPALTIQENGAPPASPLALARMRFRRTDAPIGSAEETARVELSSADGEIEIVSAANWEISVPEQDVPGLTEGKWRYNMEFTDQEADVRTYLKGNIEIESDV